MTINELGNEKDHSCYVCMEDWAFAKRRCWRRQFTELMIKHLSEATHKD